MAPAFVCSWTDGGLDAARVRVAGELDVESAPQLERMLCDHQLQARLVVLDLHRLEFIDCCGVFAIVNTSIRAWQGGRRLVVVRGPSRADRVLKLTGSADDLELGDVARPVGALARFAEEDLAL